MPPRGGGFRPEACAPLLEYYHPDEQVLHMTSNFTACAHQRSNVVASKRRFFFHLLRSSEIEFDTQRSVLRVITRLNHTPNVTTPSWWLRIVAANLGRQSKLKYYRPEKADLFYSSRVRSPGYFHREEALSYRTAREFLVRLVSLREAVSCHSGCVS